MIDTKTKQKIFKANLANVVRKVKAGKPLSTAELELVNKAETVEPVSYDSIGAAAAALSVPVALLKRAKRNGAPGFRGSRVYPSELLPWLKKREAEVATSNGPAGGGAADLLDKNLWECRKLRLQCEKIERQEKERTRELIAFAEIETWMLNTAEQMKTVLRHKLRNELPPKIEGLRAPEIAGRMDEVISEIVGLMRFEGVDDEKKAA